jgi:hypothetical protein
MTRFRTALICGAVFGLCLEAGTVPADNPYKGIVERNLFGLKDPPPPPDPAEVNKPQPSKIILTGITDILGRKQALMKIPAAPAKPGETPKGEQSFILTVGQREGDIEVLEIDPVAGMVKVRNAGVVEELNFEKNGPKLAGTPAPGAPAAPGVPGIPMPPPVATASASPSATPASLAPGTTFTAAGLRSIPTRSVRTSGSASQPAQPAYGAAYGATTYGAPAAVGATAGAPAAGTLNAGSLLAPVSTPKLQPNWPPERVMTPEEHDILVEAQRLEKANDPNWPPLPPTSLSQLQQQEQLQQQQRQQQLQQQQQQPQVPRPPGMPQF